MLLVSDFKTSMHRALKEINKNYERYPGLVICGTHTPVKNPDRLIEEIKWYREKKLPLLGVCYGFQLVAIEYARNVLGIEDATSEEWDSEGTFVVKKRPELKVGWREGETWWSNYDVSIDVEVPENFFVVPYHPEYQSWKKHKHPLLVNYMNYAMAMPYRTLTR